MTTQKHERDLGTYLPDDDDSIHPNLNCDQPEVPSTPATCPHGRAAAAANARGRYHKTLFGVTAVNEIK